MTSYLGQLGALGRVSSGSIIEGHGVTREMQLRFSPGGSPSGRMSAHRAPREWRVSIPLTHGESVAAFHQAVMGGYGTPCLWLPADAVAGNLLTPEQYAGVRDHNQVMWSNAVRDLSPVRLPDGRITGGTILPTGPSYLLDAYGQWARLPVVPGQRFHVSALLNTAGTSVSMFFRKANDETISSHGATFAGTPGLLTRTTASAVVPANAHHALFRLSGGRMAEPVATMGPTPPVRGLEGRGCAGVHVQSATGAPVTVSGDGVRSTYDVLIREAVRV